MTTTIVCAAVLAAAVFVLGFHVSMQRGLAAQQGRPQMPTDPADRLLIAIRAHGNAAEYVPTLLVLFLIVQTLTPGWWVTALVVGATASRLVHAVSMVSARSLAAESKPRMAGAMGTYVFGVALAVTAGVGALTAV